MTPLRRIFFAALFAALLWPATARAGVIRTLDGKTYEGDIVLSADGTLAVERKKEVVANVDLANLLEADFKAQTSKPQRAQVVDDRLPKPWEMIDIGRAALPGSVRFVDGNFFVKGAGGPMENRNDSFLYIYRPLINDAQIVVQITDFQAAHPRASVGLAIRENLQPLANEALLLFIPINGLVLFSRTDHQNQFTMVGRVNREQLPVWLMLARHAKTIIASKSSDGAHWDAFGRFDLALSKDAQIGIVLSSADPNVLATATCANVSVGPLNDHPTPPPAVTANSTKSIALKSGTIIGDATFSSLTDRTVACHDPQGHALNVPISEVARLYFEPLSPAILAKIPDHATGVLKPGGDFIEGEFIGLDAKHVKLSSVLFGLENLSVGDEAAVLVLRDMEPAPSTLIVRSADGSTYLAKSLQIDHAGVTLDEVTLGTLRLPAKDLVDIKAGSQRLLWLDALKPAAIEAPDSMPVASALIAGSSLAGKPLALAGEPANHALCLLAGAQVTYRLDGSAKLLLLRCGIPDAVLPTVSAQLIVSADSRQILRTPLRTSLDDPQTFSLSIAGARTLTLRVQSSAPLPCPLLCDQVQLVK